MNEFNNNTEKEGINSPESENQANNTTPIETPMFNRSAGGQYSMGQPPQFNPYYSPNPTPVYIRAPQPAKPKRTPLDRPYMKLGDAVGMPLSMFFIGSTAIQLILILILSIFTSDAISLFSDNNITYALSSVISLVVLTVPYLYTLKVTKTSFSELIPVKKTAPTKVIALVMTGFGITAISNVATNLLSSFSEAIFGAQFESSAPDYNTDIWSFLLMMLCVGILPAILEEFALRGVILGVLRKKFSNAVSIVISAVVFSLLHGNLQQIPFAFVMGLILGYATVYSGSIIPSVIIHAVNNSISVLLSFATVNMSPMVSQIVGLLYFVVCLVIGLCGFILLTKTDKSAFKFEQKNDENFKHNTKSFFCSGWMLAFVILSIIQTLTVQGIIAVE